jgi:hypothetical protein
VSLHEPPALQAPAGEELRCPVCLSLHRPGQRFCLECGAAIRDPGLPPDPATRGGRLGRGRRLALLLATLALMAIGAVIAWALTRDGDDEQKVTLLVAPPFVLPLPDRTVGETTAPPTVPTDGATLPPTTPTVPTDTVETIPTFTEPPTTEETIPDTTGTETVPAEEPIDEWPAGRDGWAAILISKEVEQFDNAYMEDLRSTAQASGLTNAGILYSDLHSSLNPGFRVLYLGPYDTREQADAAAVAAKAEGYDFAYPRRVAP